MDMFYLLSILHMAAESGSGGNGGGGGGGLMPLLPIALMVIIFWFLLIRPQRKMQREKQEMIKNLKKNDKVITRGGIIGTIAEIRPEKDDLLVDIAKNTRIKLKRFAVEGVISQEEGQDKGS